MDYNKRIEHAFNDWAATYEEDVIPKLMQRGYNYSELAKTITSYIPSEIGIQEPVLELGIGTGVLGKWVKDIRPDINIDGLDISLEMIKRAKEKQIYNNIYLGSADEHIFDTKRHFVYSAFMFHSVGNQKALLDSIAESLYDNGILVLVDLIPNLKLLAGDLNFNAHSVEYEHGAPAMYKTCGELVELFENSPFEIVAIQKLGISKDYNHYLFVLKKGEV